MILLLTTCLLLNATRVLSHTDNSKMTQQSDAAEECDFVIVGGGTGGLTVAARLAEVKEWKVCVMERGPKDVLKIGEGRPWNSGWSSPQLFTSPHDPNFFTTAQLAKSRSLTNSSKLVYIPRFRGAGGTSRIYGAIVRRPSPGILENWPHSWDLKSLEKYYMKLEDHYCHYQSEDVTGISPDDCTKYHGKGGPMQVNVLNRDIFTGFSKDFEPFCTSEASPWGGFSADYNGPNNKRLGCSIFQQFNVRTEGRANASSSTSRSSSFSGYLHGKFDPPNLRLFVDAPVTRIKFEDKKAVGVYYLDSNKEVQLIRARKEVILAGGAFDTPHILQVSGVGDKEHLSSIGVPIVAENNEVGKNLWDHISVPYVLKLREPVNRRYTSNGPFSWIIHMDTDSPRADGTKNISDIQLYFMDNSPMFSATDKICKPDLPGGTPAEFQTSIRIIHQYPSYRGSVKAASGSIFDKPIVDYNWTYPFDADNLQPFVKTFEALRAMMKTDSAWGRLIEKEILPAEGQSISDYLQEGMVSALHPACTCAMGKCADGDLKVKGVSNLRVCDASAFATQVDGNPAVTIFAMGEKLADMLKQQYMHSHQEPINNVHITAVWQQQVDRLTANQTFATVARWTGSKVAIGSESTETPHGFPFLLWTLKSHDKSALAYTATLSPDSCDAIGVDEAEVTSSVVDDGHGSVSVRKTAQIVVGQWRNVLPAAVADKVMALFTVQHTAAWKQRFGETIADARDLPLFVDAIKTPSEVDGGLPPGTQQRPYLYAMWRQNYPAVSVPTLWQSAGSWKGKLDGVPSTAPGSMNTFQLPGLPRMFEFIVNYDDSDTQFVYYMNRTEPPGQPGYDYISTKKVVPFGQHGSAYIRSGSLTVDPTSNALEAGVALLHDVYFSGGKRFADNVGWRRELNSTLLVYLPPVFATYPDVSAVAAFDLDHTLIDTLSGETFPRDQYDWKFRFASTVSKLRQLADSGYSLAILSNQGGSNPQRDTQWQAKLNAILVEVARPVIVVSALKYDDSRKPKTGMWTFLLKQLKLKQLPPESFYVGDAAGRPGDIGDSDKQFATNFGVTFFTPEQVFVDAPLQTVLESVVVNARPEEVWGVVGGFLNIHNWSPSIEDSYLAKDRLSATTSALRRVCVFPDQPHTTEELTALSSTLPYSYSYKWVHGPWGEAHPNYHSTLTVFSGPKGQSSIVQWSGSFNAHSDADVAAFYREGLGALQSRPWLSAPSVDDDGQCALGTNLHGVAV